MTTAFDRAVDRIFTDPNFGIAAWRVTVLGVGSAVRILRRQPDELTGWGGAQIVSDADHVDIRVSEAPDLASGDQIFVDGVAFRVAGEPQRDAERLVWAAQLVPA